MAKAFFCENCGSRVEGDADICPGCGRSFQAVKCPRCGKTGDMDTFRRGCPSCGFLSQEKIKGSAQSDSSNSRSEPLSSAGFWAKMSPGMTILLLIVLLLVLGGLVFLLISL
jgi:uncharacterized membrane protein YvbJ